MTRALRITLLAVLAVLLSGGIAVYAYDRSQSERIAEGIVIGGVDVGGMHADEARAELARRLLAPLAQGVKAIHNGRQFTLTAREARVGADINGMVEAALAHSRDGGAIGRTVRDLTGGTVDVRLRAKVTYSRAAVRGLVDRVAASLDREPVNWSVKPTAGGLKEVAGKDGRAVDRRALRVALSRAVRSPGAGRTVDVEVKTVRPRVTKGKLADAYPVYLTVDRSNFKLRLYKRLKLVKTYGIAVGQVGLETPAGLYHIQNKAVNPAWHVPNSDWAGDLAGQVIPGGAPNNPIRARWMGIYDGAGIHGTTADGSIGSAASHGCIRMRIPEVIELYEQVPVQTPIYIA